MNDKKFLIISNAAMSNTDSNGRTLSKLFQGVKKENLSQFFTYGSPDFAVCGNYYRVTDRDAFNSFVKLRQCGGKVQENSVAQTNSDIKSTEKKKFRKTPLSMLLREAAWSLGRWRGKQFKDWLGKSDADAIVLFVADNTFLIKLAIKTAREKNIPIFIYTTEEYNFKNYNYLTKRPSLFYGIFRHRLKKWYKRLEKYVRCGFFNTPLLADAFGNAYSYPCELVYNTSSVDFIENTRVSESKIRVSYLGNLGIGRCYPLREIADALNELAPGAKLDIYGRLPSEKEEADCLLNSENINYSGFVSYKEVVEIIHKSSLVVHAEKDDEFYSRDLKYAFSTKIADSVCSGTPLFIYARRDLAVTDFLIREKCAFTASGKNELKAELEKALFNEEERKKVSDKAKEVRNKLFLSDGSLKKRLEELL